MVCIKTCKNLNSSIRLISAKTKYRMLINSKYKDQVQVGGMSHKTVQSSSEVSTIFFWIELFISDERNSRT